MCSSPSILLSAWQIVEYSRTRVDWRYNYFNYFKHLIMFRHFIMESTLRNCTNVMFKRWNWITIDAIILNVASFIILLYLKADEKISNILYDTNFYWYLRVCETLPFKLIITDGFINQVSQQTTSTNFNVNRRYR